MKAQIESTSANICGGVRKGESGRVHKAKKTGNSHRESVPTPAKEDESAEVTAYMNKLQELVPFMPKNKKLSSFEVISNVIEYIHDLRETLGFPPCEDDEDDDDTDCMTTPVVDDDEVLMNSAIIPNDRFCFSSIVQQEDAGKVNDCSLRQQKLYHHLSPCRQPLCVISSPNGNVNMISPKIEEQLLNFEKLDQKV